jgi:putative oxidoreductase
MFHRLIHTTDDPTLTSLRVVLGIVFFAHGAQKVLGWFGGPGYAGTMSFFTQTLGIPVSLAALASLAEFLGGLGLLLGFLSRIAAFGIVVDMLVALFLVHLPNGFFMNWFGNKPGEGFEFHLLAIVIGAVIMVRGAGAVSLDRAIDWVLPIHRQAYPQPVRG